MATSREQFLVPYPIGLPLTYNLRASEEVITQTLVLDGTWIDDIQMTTSYRTYPKSGSVDIRASWHYYNGSALRYIGGGKIRNGVGYGYTGYVLAAGLEMHFIC